MDSALRPMIDIKNHPVFKQEDVFDADKYVYHFTRWERLLDISNSGFRLGSLARMNDPRESKDWFMGTTRKSGMPRVDTVLLNEAVANYRRQVKVAAFSRDQLYGAVEYQGRRAYARPRMWAQYAGNHTGVCIILNRDGLNDAIRARYPDQNDSWVRDGAVEYIEIGRQDPASYVIDFSQEKYDIPAVVQRHFAEFDKVFFVKHWDWRDEREYRWVHYDADPDSSHEGQACPYVDIREHVAALVLGSDYADAHLPVARMFAETHGLRGDVVRCLWHRVVLELIAFADGGDRWLPVDNGPRSLHMSVSITDQKDSPGRS